MAKAQDECRFVLGFATLATMVGAGAVGQCLENQQTNIQNGDAYQRTTGGLLVWRKGDNWTAFTDGFRTWVNGPRGLQERLNTERYVWEGDARAPGTTVIADAPAPSPARPPAPPPTAAVPKFTNENWGLALADANKYKGAQVDLTGKIFLEPQTDGNVTAFQMYTNAKATDGNTLVGARGAPKLKNSDYVRVQGNLVEMHEGTNAFGGKLAIPLVAATTVEIVPREQVVAPTIKTYDGFAPVVQHGLAITVQRIELAAEETRVYAKITNQSTERASVYRHQLKLVQGSRQLEAKSSFDTNYPDIPSDMLPGIEAETVVLFDAVSPSEPLRVVWDGPRLNDFRLTFQPYQWATS